LSPEDEHLFSATMFPALAQATTDLCWLLNRGYAIRSATELVGNRYALAARQRLAVARSACADQAATARHQRELAPLELSGEELWIDGLNVLTGLEVALSRGIILIGRDGCCRDVAGIHRQYRKVEETVPALRLIGHWTEAQGVTKCRWWLDKPVSNSGRLRTVVLELAAQSGWDWEAELVYNPDAVLSKTEHIVATSDSVILDRCPRWVNLARQLIAAHIPQALLVDLSRGGSGGCRLRPIEQE
jgi:hypothetical protein